MFLWVLETPLQFIFVTSLSNKRYSYHLWLLVITKSVIKKRNKFNRLQIEVFFLPNIQDVQGVLKGFLYLKIENGRDDLEKTQNGDYFRQGSPRGMKAKKYRKKTQKQLTIKRI